MNIVMKTMCKRNEYKYMLTKKLYCHILKMFDSQTILKYGGNVHDKHIYIKVETTADRDLIAKFRSSRVAWGRNQQKPSGGSGGKEVVSVSFLLRRSATMKKASRMIRQAVT